MSKIFVFLEEKKIGYALLEGIDDEYGIIKEGLSFRKDLDIVLDCEKEDIFSFLELDNNFKHLGNNSFLSIQDNLRIDLYFKTINVGYYHFLKISSIAFKAKQVSEEDYIIYQILDPLLKFSKYQHRHKYRLSQYFNNRINNIVEIRLKEIIGSKLTKRLLSKISNSDFIISSYLIKECKFRMLFINGNFVRMIKSRIL